MRDGASATASRPWRTVFVATLLLGATGNLADGFNEDELQHLHAAWLVGHGLVPYRDYFDHHPPLFHFLVAPLAVSGGTQYAALFVVLRLLGLLAAAVSAVFFARLTPRDAGRAPALLAGALLVVSRPSDILFYFRPDSVAMLLVLLGVVLAIRENRPNFSSAAAGLCVGVALFFTQKVAAVMPAFAFWLCMRIVLEREQRRREAARLIAWIVGMAVPIGVMLGLLAHLGALHGFLEGPIGFGGHWHQPDTWRKFAREPVLLGFGTVALGFAWALHAVVAYCGRREERWRGDALIGLLALFGLAAFMRTPAPTPQAYFMTVHVWLLAGALRLIAAWGISEASTVRWTYLAAGAVAALMLLTPANAVAAVVLWGVVWAVWRTIDLNRPGEGEMHRALIALGAVATVTFAATQVDRVFRFTAIRQLRSLQEIDRMIPAGSQALTTWPVLTPGRPHASFHWFSDIGMYTSMPREALEREYLAALADPRTAVVTCDPSVIRRMVPSVWNALGRGFQELPIPPDGLRGARAFVRRNARRP